MSDHIIINDVGEDVLCLGCPECDPSHIPSMHAAEIIGELAALRAEVAGLKALVSAYGELRADDSKCCVELAVAGRELGAVVAVLKASLRNVTELWAEEKNRYADLDNRVKEMDGRIRNIEPELH